MADPFRIGLAVTAGFLINTVVGYVIWREIRRIGVLALALGYLLDLVLIVNYFVEVPSAVFWACFIGYTAVVFIAAFETTRRDALSKP